MLDIMIVAETVGMYLNGVKKWWIFPLSYFVFFFFLGVCAAVVGADLSKEGNTIFVAQIISMSWIVWGAVWLHKSRQNKLSRNN